MEKLNQTFDIRFRLVGVRIPPKETWLEKYQGYEARLLLNTVLRNGMTFFVWLVEHKILLEYKRIFGYAEPLKGGIASSAELTSDSLVAKVVAHYVGKVLGLTPCENDCLMKEASNLSSLINQSHNLCNACRVRFSRLKMRFI